jgi:hypothetical protein
MALMTWKQMSEEAAMTMINMQRVIDEKDGMVEAFTQRHLQLTEQMQVLAGQTLQAARMMQNAEAEAKEARELLDDNLFMAANEREQLEYLQDMFGSPFNRFALRMEQELRANAYKGDWDQWQPSIETLKSEIGHHFKKLCQAMQQKNSHAVTEFAADIGNFMLKAIELYGNPSTPGHTGP